LLFYGMAATLPVAPLSVATIRLVVAVVAIVNIVFGFLFSALPIVAAMPDAPGPVVAREMIVVPFGVLLAVAGVERLVSRGWYARAVAVLLIAMIPFQFNTFARHYFGAYRANAAPRFDELNVREIAGEVVAMDDRVKVPGVYFQATPAPLRRRSGSFIF
jgi:hypothetical protein